MKKNKAKNGIIINAGNGNYIPNIVRGGTAIPIGKKNFYYMQGKKHEQGGIDIGKNAKTGLEVEGEEVMQVTPKEVRVYSSVPFLRGVSPADLVLNGADTDKVFAAQENYKDRNRINDDGTRYKCGGRKRKFIGGDVTKQIATNKNDFLDTWNTARLATGRYNNQLGNGKLERQAESRNSAREFHSPIAFSMNYGKRATVRTPSMSDIDYRKEVARNAQNMKLRLNKTETGQGIIGGAYHAPTHSSYINQEEFNKDNTVRTHENAHASKAVEQEQIISNIIGSNDKSDYLRRPTEIYSRLMQFRQANNINPNTVYDKNNFKELKKNAIDYNLINTFKDEEVIDLLNNVAMSNDPNKINLNNYNLNNVPVYMAKYGTKQKCKMGKLISINGNVKNGLIHTPNQDVLAYNKERKPINIDSIANAKRKDIADFLINTFNLKPRNYVDGVTGAARRVPTTSQSTSQLTRNITNGLANNALTYKKNGETHYFVEAPKVDYDSDTSLADLQNLLNLTPRKGTNQSSSSSTGGVNNRTAKSVKPAVQRVNKLAPATNAEMAGIRRGLEPLLQNTVVNKLTKNVDNDLNIIPAQTDVTKTRNMDNILLGVNLGSSVLDAVMGNIYANQMHGYNAPEITAPTISNPGEIKINEEDLKDTPAPILMAAAKLKTHYNANPQLSKIEDETRRIMGEIDRNTSNSRVALARKQRAALQGQQAKNEVYGRKENIETELINKDKLNQQEVTARNLARYDQYNQALAAQRANRARLKLAADTANIQNKLAVNTANANLKSQADRFNATNRINQFIHQAGIDAAKAEARSSIFSGMLGNIGSALNTWNRNKRQAKLDEETLRVLGLRAPNANKLVLSALGY